MEINPIAYFQTRKKHPFEAGRQGAADHSDEIGEIRLVPGHNFEQALEGLEGFSHLWVIYQFHHHAHWKPKVLPPRGSEKKVGVFATRSPYRPNSLGLSCLELVGRDRLTLFVKKFDLLDGTPIFDLKPYLAYADSFPQARLGWLENIEQNEFQIQFSKTAQRQLDFLSQQGVAELENFARQQLAYEPLNLQKKRLLEPTGQGAVLAYRTWRLRFAVKDRNIEILEIFSGYRDEELRLPEDAYHDKELHRRFREIFANS